MMTSPTNEQFARRRELSSLPARPLCRYAVESIDDRRLIQECLKGRSAAYGELVRRYQDRLFNTVYRLVDNADDANDVVQEAFISAYQSLESFKGDAQFFTWLYRIAMNAAISLKRKRKVALSIETGSKGDLSIDPIDETAFNQPGDLIEQQEQEAQLKDALNKLSPEHKAVLILKDIEGQKYEVIAEILQVPIGTIRSRLHRARMELRELMQKEEQ
jgi:RNA polymerase sigma-70 factor (ECF subfamily)